MSIVFRSFAATCAGLALVATAFAGASGAAPAGTTAGFKPIVEPFDPGHAARVRPPDPTCKATSTAAIVACADIHTENTDAAIDTVRQRTYDRATTAAARAAVNGDDAAWLANRQPVCQAGYTTGGTIDEIDAASCDTAVSAARLRAVRGERPVEAHLATSDSPPELQYATTPGGARIAALASQGDQTGGTIIAWTVIAGYRGFTVHPGNFTYVDGAFVDRGIVQPGAGGTSPAGHVVAPGTLFVFSIDYSTIGHDRGRHGAFRYVDAGRVIGAWT